MEYHLLLVKRNLSLKPLKSLLVYTILCWLAKLKLGNWVDVSFKSAQKTPVGDEGIDLVWYPFGYKWIMRAGFGLFFYIPERIHLLLCGAINECRRQIHPDSPRCCYGGKALFQFTPETPGRRHQHPLEIGKC